MTSPIYLKIDHVDKTFAAAASETEVLQRHHAHDRARASSSRSSAIPAAASRRCSTSSPGSRRRPAAACCWKTARSTRRAPTAPSCSRTIRCCRGSPSTTTCGSRSTRCSPAPSRAAERHAWTMHNLDLVQMAHAKDKRPAEISGGMKQRVGIARALAMEPKVLLLDEPFGALDALTRAHLQDSVMAIHQKLGNTVLMITHDVDEAVLLSDRIVMMTNGPAARIGEVLDVPLARPRKRLELAANPTYLKMPPARARVPLRAPPLRRGGVAAMAFAPPPRLVVGTPGVPASHRLTQRAPRNAARPIHCRARSITRALWRRGCGKAGAPGADQSAAARSSSATAWPRLETEPRARTLCGRRDRRGAAARL